MTFLGNKSTQSELKSRVHTWWQYSPTYRVDSIYPTGWKVIVVVEACQFVTVDLLQGKPTTRKLLIRKWVGNTQVSTCKSWYHAVILSFAEVWIPFGSPVFLLITLKKPVRLYKLIQNLPSWFTLCHAWKHVELGNLIPGILCFWGEIFANFLREGGGSQVWYCTGCPKKVYTHL